MIKLFRKIRQNLLSEGRTGRYLKYAIGEILLVVIGILIALQINTWNEGRKTLESEKAYLTGIKNDLIQDTIFLSDVIYKHKMRMAQIIDQDSSINISDLYEIGTLPIPEPVEDINYFLNAERRFRSKIGSYSSLISEGKASLISNRALFSRIQGIYEQDIKSSDVIGQEMWDKSIRMAEKHSSEIKYTDFGNPVVISNKALLADLNLSFDLINIYTWFSIIIIDDIKVLISDIEAELSTL